MRNAFLIFIFLTSSFIYSEIKNSYEIHINPKVQVRQGLNQCGPASAMTLINVYTQKVMPLETVNNEMGGRMGNYMTYPWGITKYLKSNGIKSSIKILKAKTEKSRLKFLKKTLSQGKPIIMLNNMDGVLHYFTLLGYNSNNEFYIYDSMQPLEIVNDKRMTVDSNGSKPGNLTMDWQILYKRWEEGSYKFINFLLIVPKEGIE